MNSSAILAEPATNQEHEHVIIAVVQDKVLLCISSEGDLGSCGMAKPEALEWPVSFSRNFRRDP